MSDALLILLRPLLALDAWLKGDDDEGGVHIAYPLSAFFAFGIWLVYERYQKAHNSAVPFYYPTPVAADPGWKSLDLKNPHLESHLTDTRLLPPAAIKGRRYITSYDPAIGYHIETNLADNEDEISKKIQTATASQKDWKKTSFTQRRRVMRSLLKWLVDNQEVCAKVACRDTGKTLIDAALGEILTTCSKLEWLIKHGEKALRPENRSANTALFYKKSQVHYEPLGVVAGIVSWNYPLHNAWSPIIAAIFAGNGVVLKCSENVVWSSHWFVGAIQQCLSACGHSPDIVQVVCCWPEEAPALTRSPLIKHITFIGSEEVGRKIAADALVNLTPINLELGGKDPAIILPDTDLKQWVSVWMRGIFQNAGQNCIGIERVIVHNEQYDDLFEMLSEKIKILRPGSVLAPSLEGYISPVDCGSMIDDRRFPGLLRLVKDAEEEGAKVEGAKIYEHPVLNNGVYFQPGIIGPVYENYEIAQVELFAPIALLMPYDTVEEAIEIANGTKYGLGASVFGPSQSQCVEVAKQLECGMVSVNDFGVFYLNQDLPFGGTKSSGYGRFGGREGLRALTNPKAIMVDRWPWMKQTSIPKVLDYPIRSLGQSWDFASGLVRFLYGDGWQTKLIGLIALGSVSRKY